MKTGKVIPATFGMAHKQAARADKNIERTRQKAALRKAA